MISAELKESFLAYIRLGIIHNACTPKGFVDCNVLKALADEHGLSAVMLDGIKPSSI